MEWRYTKRFEQSNGLMKYVNRLHQHSNQCKMCTEFNVMVGHSTTVKSRSHERKSGAQNGQDTGERACSILTVSTTETVAGDGTGKVTCGK